MTDQEVAERWFDILLLLPRHEAIDMLARLLAMTEAIGVRRGIDEGG
jgi:hypothetical protein